MKICAYVQTSYAKPVYKTECFNVRAWVGMSVIIDVLNRAGYQVEYAGKDTVHQYDIVLVSLTSDCDWWQFISERVTWRKGNYKVIIGGAGLLNIRPFREYADCFIFGRGENLIVPVVEALAGGDEYSHESVAYRETFSVDSTYKQGNKFWAVEGMGTDSLSTHALSAICHRGTEKDADNARKVACNRKFWNSNSAVKQATIEKYFDVDALFGRYTWDTLPTRYLHTYANIPKMIEKMGP